MSFLKKVFDIADKMRKGPETFESFAFVDGLIDEKVRPVCAQKMVDGKLEWCCWKCGGIEGLFSQETAIDVPRNNQGAWVRLHKDCA